MTMKDSNGNEFGSNVSIYRDVLIRRSSIGEKSVLADDVFMTDCIIGSYARIERRAMLFNVQMGTCCNIGWNSTIRNCNIGDYTGFAWNVSIGGAQHQQHSITMRSIAFDKWYDFITEAEEEEMKNNKNFDWYSGDIHIGNDVWGGAGCQIMRGVTIGDGAILGAGSVVTHDVGPYEIWAGVPAKKIGQRFSDEIISELMEMQWWRWPREIIKENITYFQKIVDLELLKKLRYRVEEQLRSTEL